MKVVMEKLTFWTSRQNVCIQFFKSQRVSMTVQIEKMTLHSWSPMVFIFFFIFQFVSVFHPSYTRLTWALAYFSSRTFLPSLSSRSVLTKRCSTTWFEGTVTGFFVLCKRKKYLLNTKYAFYVPHQRWFFYLFYEHQCLWTLLFFRYSVV